MLSAAKCISARILYCDGPNVDKDRDTYNFRFLDTEFIWRLDFPAPPAPGLWHLGLLPLEQWFLTGVIL